MCTKARWLVCHGKGADSFARTSYSLASLKDIAVGTAFLEHRQSCSSKVMNNSIRKVAGNITHITFCCQTQDGVSPVYVASQKGHTDVVDLLVQAGADIHLATTEVHVSTHTVSSSVAVVVEINVRLIEFVVYDLHFQCSHPRERK